MQLPFKTRLLTHGLTLVSALFLAIYTRLVCPFVNDVPFSSLLMGLGYVTAFQLILREILLRRLRDGGSAYSLPRRAFFAAVISWGAAGLVAIAVHALRYPDFPPASHLKLMTGYWGLGAGLLAQLEYAIYERALRGGTHPVSGRSEQLAFRLLEGFALFTLVPALVMSLLVARYIYEKLIIPGVAAEILFLSGYFVAVALVVAWLWGKTLREDARQITSGLAEIEQGRFDGQLSPRRGDELGVVALGINRMARGLQQREKIREAFGRFVSPEVAERFIRTHVRDGEQVKMGGHRRVVAVLISDLRGFTPLSESLEPEQLTELLNGYFTTMVEAIQSHGGLVDKFMGDAVMAVFGHLDDPRNHAMDAVSAAVAMRSGLAAFNQAHADGDWPALENGVGIHLGEVVAGYFGSPDRLEFTVIGPTVNLAARIEAQTKPPHPPILFSGEVAAALSPAAGAVEVGEFDLKGVSRPITLFTIEGQQRG